MRSEYSLGGSEDDQHLRPALHVEHFHDHLTLLLLGEPKITIAEMLRRFIEWFSAYSLEGSHGRHALLADTTFNAAKISVIETRMAWTLIFSDNILLYGGIE